MANGTLKVGTITTSSGSGTITIPSGVTLSGGVANTPAVLVTNSGSQSISHNSTTLVTFDTERFDLGSNFNTTTYSYTPPSNGYYCFNFAVSFRGGANTNLARCNVGVKKGSSTFLDWEKDFSASYVLNAGTAASFFANVSDSDAYKLYVNVTDQSGNPSILGTITNSYFEGWRIA